LFRFIVDLLYMGIVTADNKKVSKKNEF